MSFTSEAAAAQQIQERLKALKSLIHDIKNERLRSEHTLDSIDKTHEKITQEGKITPYSQQKLKGLYMTAITDGSQEEELLRQALSKIYEIRAIYNERRLQARSGGFGGTIHRGTAMKMVKISAHLLPLWVGKPGTKAPPLCGAVPADPNYIAKPGDMVAALVNAKDEENWILAEVVSFNPITKKYEVDDIDEEHKPRHTLSKSRVVPLPLMRANPETDPEALFPKGTVVMALYPQTTCLYKAIVNQLPTSPTDEYEVLFEDRSYPDGLAPPLNVSQRYVIDIKK